MKQPATPDNEQERLQVLERLQIIHTPAEERFDRVTRLASRLLQAPIALVSLVTSDKQWFKSRQGLAAIETSREISFCGHAILNDDPFVVPNALKDPDFKDNPLVTGPPDIRFYAGQPIHFDNHRIGTLCVIDTKPRHLRPADYDSLKSLGHWLELELKDWYQQSNSFLRKVINYERQEYLLDPLTGNINDTGLRLIRQKLVEHELEAEYLTIEINYGDCTNDEIDFLRLKLAELLRSAVSDHGIVGLADEDRFNIILIDPKSDTKTAIKGMLHRGITELQESSDKPATWSWQLLET